MMDLIKLPRIVKTDTQLRRVLDTLFPLSDNSICANRNIIVDYGLLQLSCGSNDEERIHDTENQPNLPRRVSAEPASRSTVLQLRHRLNTALIKHRAKLFGLCQIRRNIYEQCFDELIRQVTVGCIEQGLLLFRVRNESNLMIDCYTRLYESAIAFGVNKAVEAEVTLLKGAEKIKQLEKVVKSLEDSASKFSHDSNVKQMNEANALERIEEQYNNELKRRDEIIEQQQNIIKTLTKAEEDIWEPTE